MSWLLKINGAEHTLESIMATGGRLKKRALGCDELSISTINPALAETGAYIELWKNGVRRFCGTLKSKRFSSTPKADTCEMTFKGPWCDLHEIPYLQPWAVLDSTADEVQVISENKTRIVLGVDKDGQNISVGNQIKSVLEYAMQNGANFSIGNIDSDAKQPADEATDLSCEESIFRSLRWTPDIVSYFDYSESPAPRLAFKRRSQLESLALSPGTPLKKLSYAFRDDLQISNVCIIYEKTHTHDGDSWNTHERDIYPEGSEFGGKKSLVMTVALAGTKSSVQRQRIVTKAVHPNMEDWCREKFPQLNSSSISRFVIEESSRISSLPNELVSGSVYDWMMKAVEKDIATVIVSCYDKNGEKIDTRRLTYRFTATNATTRTYSNIRYSAFEEKIPEGLAKSIYDACSDLQVEGEAEIAEFEDAELLCKRISIPGKFENAVVVESSLDLFTKAASIKFGPPKHLYPADIAQVYRMARPRNISTSGKRTEPKAISERDLDLAEPDSAYDASTETLTHTKLELVDPEEDSKSATINLNDITHDGPVEIKLRKYYIIDNGEPKQAYILMSQPLEIQ